LANPDAIFALVADDATVKEAAARWDCAAASTHRDLVAARLDAQARAGIPEANRAPLSSGEVDDYLIPIVMRMGRGDEPAVVADLRKALRRLYGAHAETVLAYIAHLPRERPCGASMARTLRRYWPTLRTCLA
jgi:hypothetical protein